MHVLLVGTGSINVTQRVVQSVCVAIEGLGILRSKRAEERVRTGKSSLCSAEVSSPKVIEARLGIPFLAGKPLPLPTRPILRNFIIPITLFI